ncbi:hypothetical protein RFN29_11785 [Mesorhizobium sp. VK22B]|uniref:Uncharacterized protein n=1 Tax=Mesorhizobium captivum TaxID=3072319 RepID=A0ABU4Z0Y9_9HYPH|nr:hypothetical protein [Mesorhizobium sp. VK22B]MDX8492263.1 hypothetical protein [Mesorhizobium sp. VK22B]
MPRYATIITDDDGAEIVSAIGEFESSGLPRRAGRVEEVAPGVRIGMVRGGAVDAVAGFGFPRQGLDHAAIVAVTTKLKAASGPSDEAASLGVAAPPKAVRAKPRKKAARRAGKAKAARSIRTSPTEAVASD